MTAGEYYFMLQPYLLTSSTDFIIDFRRIFSVNYQQKKNEVFLVLFMIQSPRT